MWRRRDPICRPRRGLGGVPALPQRLPAPRRQARRHAAAVGELSRLRHRVRHRGARARGCEALVPRHLEVVRLRAGALRLVVQRIELRVEPRRGVPLALERARRGWRGRLVRRRGRRRLVTPDAAEEAHRALQSAAVAADAAAQRRLLAGDELAPSRSWASPSASTGSRGRSRRRGATAASWACSRRRSWPGMRRGGRLCTGSAERRARVADGRLRARARVLAAGDDDAAGEAADRMAAGGEAFARTALALAALARRDEVAYGTALRAVIADFEAATCISRAFPSRIQRSCSSASPRRAGSPSGRRRRSCPRPRSRGASRL